MVRATGDERDLWEAVRKQGPDVLDRILTNLARKIVKEQADAQERGRKQNKG